MIPRSVLSATFLAIVVLLDPSPLRAQEPPASAVLGERVRVDYVLSGTLVEREGRLLVVEPDEGGPAESVPVSDINRLEAWRCCNRMEGFFLGALIGAGTAVVGGLVLQTLDAGEGANMAMAGAVLVGVPLGVLVGGGIGSSALAPHHWVEVEVPPLER